MAKKETAQVEVKDDTAAANANTVNNVGTQDASATAVATQAVNGSLPVNFADQAAADGEADSLQLSAKDLTLPWLLLLQSNSKAVTEGEPNFVPNASKGQFMNSVSKRCWDGKEGVVFIPCTYEMVWNEFTPGEGGKFVRKYSEVEKKNVKTIQDKNTREEYIAEGSIDGVPGNILKEARQFVIAIIDTVTGETDCVLLGLASTNLKIAATMLARYNAFRYPKADPTQKYKPALYQTAWKLKTNLQKNDKGSWYGMTIDYLSPMWDLFEDKNLALDIYNSLREFSKNLVAHGVKADGNEAPF